MENGKSVVSYQQHKNNPLPKFAFSITASYNLTRSKKATLTQHSVSS